LQHENTPLHGRLIHEAKSRRAQWLLSMVSFTPADSLFGSRVMVHTSGYS
jgi:hypothetical protein